MRSFSLIGNVQKVGPDCSPRRSLWRSLGQSGRLSEERRDRAIAPYRSETDKVARRKGARPNLTPLFLLLLLFFLSGCFGYRLGSTLPADVKKIYVPLFANKSREPLIENEATAATIAELQKDGTLKVVNAGNADVILECTLTSVSLNPLRYDRADVTKPNEYRMTLAASFTLKRISGQEILCEASVIGEATFPFVGNLVSAKQSALPKASEDLAKRIVEKAIEAW